MRNTTGLDQTRPKSDRQTTSTDDVTQQGCAVEEGGEVSEHRDPVCDTPGDPKTIGYATIAAEERTSGYSVNIQSSKGTTLYKGFVADAPGRATEMGQAVQPFGYCIKVTDLAGVSSFDITIAREPGCDTPGDPKTTGFSKQGE